LEGGDDRARHGPLARTVYDPATGKTTLPNGRAFDHPGAMYIVYGPDHTIKKLSIFWDTLVVDKHIGVAP
jgi:hypothetical protein